MDSRRGSVIIAALWTSALIMWLGLMVSADVRMEGEEEVVRLRRSQSLYLAVGGAYEALARMAAFSPTDVNTARSQWRPEDGVHFADYRTGRVAVRIEEEDAKLNVNGAQPAALAERIVAAGAKPEDGPFIADAIADFIDADDVPRLKGMEKEGYARLGLRHGPLNWPMSSLEQLLLVPGITPQLFQDLVPAIRERGGERLVSDIMIPAESSLFSTLSVFSNNSRLKTTRQEPLTLGERRKEEAEPPVDWRPRAAYRIIAAGKSFSGPPSVVLCLIVRYLPGQNPPYEILQRSIL